jgi:hypothetical protein
MTRYIARTKDVLGKSGHAAEICQRSIEIEAPSKGQCRQAGEDKVL